MKLIAFISFFTTTAASLLFEKNELRVPVELYNDDFENPAAPYPPRYVVGTLGIPHLLHHLFTFDMGNSRESILTISSCLGCEVIINGTSVGCPPTAPTCSENGGICWESDPEQPLPLWSYQFVNGTDGYCFNSTGYLMVAGQNVSTCMQCFGGQSHSRFTSLAQFHPNIQIYFLNSDEKIYPPFPQSFQFGALVRTVPLTDRIWSNIGIGNNSSFMEQMDITRLLLRLSPQEGKEIIFHPSNGRHQNAANSSVVDFTLNGHSKRMFHFSSVKIGDEIVWMNVDNDHKARLDTGCDGIHIDDPLLQDQLANITGGIWSYDKMSYDEILPDAQQQLLGQKWERLYIPKESEAKPLYIALGNTLYGYSVQVTISNWTFPGKDNSSYLPTIFRKYHKTVLGLPYLAATGTEYLFDDENLIMHIIGGEMMWNGEDRENPLKKFFTDSMF